MMGRRLPLRSGDEYDTVTRWRRYLKRRAGVRKAIKRSLRRRERHQGFP